MKSQIQDHARSLRGSSLPALATAMIPLILLIFGAAKLDEFVAASFDRYHLRVMMDVGIAIVLAVSLNIVNGYTGQFSIGHAGFFAVGGYVSAALTYYVTMSVWGEAILIETPVSALWPFPHLPPVGAWIFVGAAILGGLVAAGAGYLVGLPSLRLRGDYLAIVTLGFGEICRVLLERSNPQFFDVDSMREATVADWLPLPLGSAQGFTDVPKYTSLFWVYAFVAVTLVFAYRLKQSATGRALLSIREDETAAQAMGVNVTLYKVRAFVFAAFFAGLAGALYAHQPGTILRPLDAGFMRSFDVIIIVVLGGMGSISGATLAAVLLTVMAEWLRDPTHVWYLALYIGLARVALTPRDNWRDLVVIGSSAVALESCRAAGLFALSFPLLSVQVTGYELVYATLLVVFCILRKDVLRGVLFVAGVVAFAELVRWLALKYPVVRFGPTEIPLRLGDYRMVIYALLLVSVMIFRPQGLLGLKEIWDFLPSRRHAPRTAAPRVSGR
ncbi:MAG: branched-chain amino acid ABC transporter permease [Phycisphaerales bacterium]|nr:branched-chain amino acid ABC transporter permease [Phycisphaerales bacterium]